MAVGSQPAGTAPTVPQLPPNEPAVRDYRIGLDLRLCGLERQFEAQPFPLTPQHTGELTAAMAP
jgi:hypothetical protein